MSTRPARSSSTLQAARAAVAERARRSGSPSSKGPAGKGPAGKAGSHRAGQAKSARSKQPASVKKDPPQTTPGKAPRSTAVVLRRVRPGSVLRISVLFYLSLSLALFVAVVLLWMAANAVGLVGNIEGFMDDVGFTDFRLQPGPLLVGWGLISVILVVTGSLANFLMAVLYNLIGDVVGGIKVVLTEDPGITKK